MKQELVLKNLQRSILFKEASSEELRVFGERSYIHIVPKGEYVYHQNDESDAFYVIALGEAELLVEREDGVLSNVGRVGPGGHFGETTILTDRSRTLSVRALFDLVLICFDKVDFVEVLLENSNIHKQLDISLAERLQVAFMSQAGVSYQESAEESARFDDVLLFDNKNLPINAPQSISQGAGIWKSRTAKLTQRAINKFAENSEPFLLAGDNGTGKKMIARQVHHQSESRNGMYIEIDLREQKKDKLADKLFGQHKDNLPFFQLGQTGVFEQSCGGTIVFIHAELLDFTIQERILKAVASGVFTQQDNDQPIALQSRLVFVSSMDLESCKQKKVFVSGLLQLFDKQYFRAPSLKENKRDLPRFIKYYLDRYSKEYDKNVLSVPKDTLGLLMNYDWPGNLSELSSVLKRAVMLSQKNEIVADQILLGLPKTEGKWEFNLLRIPIIRRCFESWAFPLVPQIIVGVILLFAVVTLFFGPSNADENIGITVSWALGWPLLFISFFFLARMWCSVCTLATPGIFVQRLLKPKRKTPTFIKEYSGWIMAILCVLVLWVEIVWNAYDSPFLSGCIIMAITIGSLLFSLLFSRRSWCRYLCPLGAINAIFAMPSILELRSNRHLCLNQCTDHSCFRGGDGEDDGCPMFQHPFMVDNNRDCIFCGKCVKNCDNESILLNLRLAPQELWDIKVPRLADSFLVISLMAIFFPFAMRGDFFLSVAALQGRLTSLGMDLPFSLVGSVLFFSIIIIFQLGYLLLVKMQERISGVHFNRLIPFLGYGFIPIVLGGYLAVHFDILVSEVWRLIPNFQVLLGMEASYLGGRILSAGATTVLQTFFVLGGLVASMYATYRIVSRLQNSHKFVKELCMLPYMFLSGLAVVFFLIL